MWMENHHEIKYFINNLSKYSSNQSAYYYPFKYDPFNSFQLFSHFFLFGLKIPK